MKKTVLCFVLPPSENRLLMIWKKRGQGEGKWNVPGGKIQPQESAIAAAIRETQEETGITPANLVSVGHLEFRFENSRNWDNDCEVFIANTYRGNLLSDAEECRAEWVGLDSIPFEKMWTADREWIPLLLAGKYFHFRYTFGANDELLRSEAIR